MDLLTAACATGVAVLLAWSAGAKWGRPAALAVAMDELRLPPGWSRPAISRALPLAELALAFGLVLLPASWALVAVAAAATALMVTYTVIIARALGFHPRPRCGCFGEANIGPIGPTTLIRNLVLVAATGTVLTGALGGHSTIAVVSRWGWLAIVGLAAGLAAVAGWQYLRRPSGRPATILTGGLIDATGATRTWPELAGQQWRSQLVLITCTCAAAARAVNSLPRWQHRADGPLILVSLLEPGLAERSFPLPGGQQWFIPGGDWQLDLPADQPALVWVDADGVVLRTSIGLDAMARSLS